MLASQPTISIKVVNG